MVAEYENAPNGEKGAILRLRPPGRPRRAPLPLPTPRLQRQPLLRGPVQDDEVHARLPRPVRLTRASLYSAVNVRRDGRAAGSAGVPPEERRDGLSDGVDTSTRISDPAFDQEPPLTRGVSQQSDQEGYPRRFLTCFLPHVIDRASSARTARWVVPSSRRRLIAIVIVSDRGW